MHETQARGKRRRRRPAEAADRPQGPPPPVGGSYRPLTETQLGEVHRAALQVLERIGMSDPIPEFLDIALDRGCFLNRHGRLCFPAALIEDIVARAAKSFVLHGQKRSRDIEISGSIVHYATGGMAVTMLDLETRAYRPSTLQDLYDSARLVDTLDNIHFFNRMMVPTDIADPYEVDLNIAFACASGTSKPIGIGFALPGHVARITGMLDLILGRAGGFRERPIATCNCCIFVPPLRFGADNSRVMLAAIEAGYPIKMPNAPQAGSTAPAALAGTLVQSTAEILAGVAMVNMAREGHPVFFSSWPLVSDLRTGSFSGGGGEGALLAAAAAQIGNHYGLPTSVAAGMTDAKMPDIQSGFEKGITNVLAGMAGANSIGESIGMMASLMGCSLESFVLDDDMLGIARRAIRGIEVTEETLSVDVIEQAVLGPGHYLDNAQTLALMKTEYVYPRISDRTSPGEWEAKGSPSILEAARERTREILATHHPDHIPPATLEAIREKFPIRLAPAP